MTPTDSATNHLTGATYDSSGNIRSWNGPPPYYQVPTYDYDELNQLKHYKNGAQEWFYMYGPGGERIWSFQPPGNGLSRFDRWTLRGLDEKVRRTFELYGDNWTNNWGGSNLWEDHIYRDGTLLGAYSSDGHQHQIDVDHLGTPRLITTTVGGQFAYHVYLPYGVEAVPTSDFHRLKFTGHERDLADLSSTADDLDYMHARHTNPTTGRFLSVDPMGANPRRPQTWNRYSYVTGNPLRYVDPQGLAEVDACNDNSNCVGSITVIDKAPAQSDPLTGLNELIAGRADLDNLAAGDPEFGTQVLRRAGALAEGPVDAETSFLKYLALFAPGFGEMEVASLGAVDTGAINVFTEHLV